MRIVALALLPHRCTGSTARSARDSSRGRNCGKSTATGGSNERGSGECRIRRDDTTSGRVAPKETLHVSVKVTGRGGGTVLDAGGSGRIGNDRGGGRETSSWALPP